MWRRTIDCLGVLVAIRADVPALAPRLDAIFRGYRESGDAPAVAYELQAASPSLLRDGVVVRRFDAVEDLAPGLEIDLYREVMARAAGLMLHAGAVVGRGGSALVLAGRSGAGKSTLVRALVARGFGYMTEECVALRGGRCAGLPRPLHVDDDAIARPDGWGGADYVIRQDGRQRRLRLFHAPDHLLWQDDARTAAVLHIDHAPGTETALVELQGGAALAALWPCAFRTDESALGDAAAALTEVATYRLRTASPDAAIERVGRLAAELDVHPL